jgi:glycosyltransferase involved in cell wall biosynthesis
MSEEQLDSERFDGKKIHECARATPGRTSVPTRMNSLGGPLVTAVIPTYRSEMYVRAAVESALAQTYGPLEVVVIDSNGDDRTWSKLKDLSGQIVYARAPARGIAAGRNEGITRASGELIALLDSDDLWMPTKIVEQVDALAAHPEAGLCCTDTEVFDESGAFKRSMIPDPRSLLPPGVGPGEGECVAGWFYEELLMQVFMNTSSVVVRRHVFDDVGMFDETLRIGEEYDRWLAIAQRYPIVLVNRVLTRYRLRPDSVSGGGWEDHLRIWDRELGKARLRHIASIPRNLGQSAREQAQRYLRHRAWECLHMGNMSEARLCLRKEAALCGLGIRTVSRWCATFLPVKAARALRRYRTRVSRKGA